MAQSGWQQSDRRSRLPKDWAKRVATTKRRAGGRCEAEQHESECTGRGAQCDHRQRGDDHSLTNLQWLSVPCHEAKTRREAADARAAMQARARHPTERPPGLL